MATSKSSSSARGGDTDAATISTFDLPIATPSGGPPTYASFSPVSLSTTTPTKFSSSLSVSSAVAASKHRSTILVHQKSPLLLATPPQITRALAYSHPFLLPLNKLVGLLSWTTGDAWESFLLLCGFWAVVLYGDAAIRIAGPLVLVLCLILGMYSRRYSPLSSSGWQEPAREVRNPENTAAGGGGNKDAATAANGKPAQKNGKAAAGGLGVSNGAATGGGGGGHQRSNSEVTSTRHQKTLDEIVETLKEFTGRCNILLEPLLELTDFLSTQRTPTSATTRPALTTLFVRLLLCAPAWWALTLPPLRLVTARRVVLVLGTLVLSWHSRVMRVARTILWRSRTVRRLAALITGLAFETPAAGGAGIPGAAGGGAGAGTVAEAEGTARSMLKRHESELTRALRRQQSHHHGHAHRTKSGGSGLGKDAGLRFTFILYENQRRWVGLGWTTSLFAYERAAWTDEHNNAVPAKEDFELPGVAGEGGRVRWRWAAGSRWRVDGVVDEGDTVDYNGESGKMGWIYYDNKWQNGRRGQDGWGRWTRRRKWYRDAELVEVLDDDVDDDEGQPEGHGRRNANGIAVAELDAEATRSQPEIRSQPPTPTSNIPSAQSYSTLDERMVSGPAARSEPSVSQADRSEATSENARRVPGGAGGSSKASDSGASTSFKGDDSSSVLSTSSRSFFLRRRGMPERGSSAISANSAGSINKEADHSRRESEVKSEEEAAALGLQVELEMQGHGKEGRWGIGDEAEMSLE